MNAASQQKHRREEMSKQRRQNQGPPIMHTYEKPLSELSFPLHPGPDLPSEANVAKVAALAAEAARIKRL